MCGISAIVGADVDERASAIQLALGRIEHRGQKEHRYEIADVPECMLTSGAHRLAITASQEGRQPMTGPAGRMQLVFNGEVYNHRALRAELGGLPFRTESSDTEVLAAALECWGPAATLEKLDWEGTFVAIDRSTRSIVAARDPIGVKPLYRARFAGGVAFASEIKALVPLPQVRAISPLAGGKYIAGRVDAAESLPETIYWQASTVTAAREAQEEELLAEELYSLLRAAVHSRVPDFHYAVALSGGIDSAAVLRLALDRNDDVTAYTLHRPGSEDLRYAQELCRELEVDLVTVAAAGEDELAEDLPLTIAAVETWEWHVLTHALPMRSLTKRIAADGHKVVLSGEGSDEIFGGYPTWDRDVNRRAERLRRLEDLSRTNCRRLDRIGMADTLEFRVPFLQRRLVEFALSLSTDRFDGRPIDKWLLRESLKEVLPQPVLERPKLSFARGAGYDYGAHSQGRALLAERVAPRNATGVPPQWKAQARFPAEERFLELFCDNGYDRAPYLCSRTI